MTNKSELINELKKTQKQYENIKTRYFHYCNLVKLYPEKFSEKRMDGYNNKLEDLTYRIRHLKHSIDYYQD